MVCFQNLSILTNFVAQYVPASQGSPSQFCQHPPNSLKTTRRNAWLAYKYNRSTYGSHSYQAVLALEQFKMINTGLCNYYIAEQLDSERFFIEMKQKKKWYSISGFLYA